MTNKQILLNDNESLDLAGVCAHKFSKQANVKIEGIIWDIYFCERCLMHVKKERPCPYYLEEIKN